MTVRLFITVLLSAFFSSVPARDNKITITGLSPEYSGKAVEFHYFQERAFDSRESIARVDVDSSGYFSFTFDSQQTIAIYCESGFYTGYLFAEPGRNYSISLPPIPAIELQSQENPYFMAPLWHILPVDSIISGVRDLNFAIRDFELIFEPFAQEQLSRFSFPEISKVKLDSFITVTNFNIPVTDPVFYTDYLTYKIAQSEFLVSEYNRSELFIKYFENRIIPMTNPAFWDFYSLYFDSYINTLAVRKEFKDIYLFMGKELYEPLTELLKKDPVLMNDTIREFVLLNEFYQGFYRKDYPLQLSLNLIDTINLRSNSSLTKRVGEELKESILALQPGYTPPPLNLRSPDGKEYDIQSFNGKYCYLGFCSFNNMECLKEFEYLKYQNSKHNKYLQIITVVPENETENIQSFTEFNSITWPVLVGINQKKLFSDFKVRAFPVFYLFDKEGKLVLSPSPFPSENFEQLLFNLMRSKGDI